jgi:nucleotide-binding universal stress UspA family protein
MGQTDGVDGTIVLCVDGSEASLHAARVGLDRLAPAGRVVIVTVVEAGDPTLVTGLSGMAGGAMSAEELDVLNQERAEGGEALIRRAMEALDLEHAEGRVAFGDPGLETVAIAEELDASVVVVGSRGMGGLRRAVLGSVSDHLVRHAACPVLVVRDDLPD